MRRGQLISNVSLQNRGMEEEREYAVDRQANSDEKASDQR
jgi:hypothetical protein